MAEFGRMASPRPDSVNARDLDADRHPWERQPEESAKAYAAFLDFRDSEHRSVSRLREKHGGSVKRWSSMWSWGYRSYQHDLFLDLADQQAQVRLRREMNERHRRAARFAQSKVVEWLQNADVSKMNAADAARWFDIAVKVERMANGAGLPAEERDREPEHDTRSLADLLNVPADIEAELARLIHEATTRQPPPHGANGSMPPNYPGPA